MVILNWYFENFTFLCVGLVLFGVIIGIWINILAFKFSRANKRLTRKIEAFEKKIGIEETVCVDCGFHKKDCQCGK